LKKNLRISDFIIEGLSQLGLKHIFLLPGGGNMFLIDAVAKSKKIEGIPCHHEQAAAIAAEAYSRVSDNVGVAIVTSGPGSTNAITGLLGAWIESVPLIIISGQVKTSDIDKNVNLRQQGVQGAEILKIVKNITKFSVSLTKKTDFKKILTKCINIAKNKRKGPVWIEVPLDIQAQLTNKKINLKKSKSKNIKTNNFNFFKFKKLIRNAKRPIFLIGHGVRLSNASKSFKKNLKNYPFPSVFTWNAMDILPYEHNLNCGRPGVVAQRFSNFVIQNSDLLISIGCRIDNIITAFNQNKFAQHAKKIIVDIDINELKKFKFKIDMALNMDASKFINTINKIKPNLNENLKNWQNRCKYWKNSFSIDNENMKKSAKRIDHYSLIDKLSKNIRPKTLICTGSSGLAVEVFYSVFKNKTDQRIFLTSGLGSMGYGLPSAIGSCFANKRRPMILIEGDGSFQLNIQELAVIQKFNLPICIIIINNNGYCSIRNTQKNYFNGRFLGTGPKSNLIFPNLKKISAAYKIKYEKISSIQSLNKKFKNNFKLNKYPKIIEIIVTSNETLKPKVSAIPQKNGNIISMPLEDMTPLLPIKTLEREMLIPLSKISYKARGIRIK